MLPRSFCLAFVWLTLGTTRAATIDVTYNLVPSNAQVAIDHAASIWEGILVSPVPIKVLVNWAPLGASALGITFPNGRKDFVDAPSPQTWYATALANALSGTELNPGENDIEIYLNSGTNWYLGTDGMPGAGQYDLVSIALHELGHGLGFVGLAKKTGTQGSFGLLQMSDFSPLITTFPWPQLDTLPGIFDRYLRAADNSFLVDAGNPSDPLGTLMSSNAVNWGGPLGLAASGGSTIRIYSPSAFALGSSCVHLNESTYPNGNVNELMTPFSSSGDANHWPGPLCLGMMQDIGWTLAPDVGFTEPPNAPFTLHVWTDPSGDLLLVDLPQGMSSVNMSISSITGTLVRKSSTSGQLDIRCLSPGPYIVHIEGQQATTAALFIK
jgi:hypothetical protein